MPTTYEACVSSIAQARAAQNAGADRLELCARLGVGGLTPPMTRLAAVRAAVSIPVHVMIRPRPGDFTGTFAKLEVMERAIGEAREAGADGVVFGVLLPEQRVDLVAMRRLVRAAVGLSVTMHRAFDLVPAPMRALEQLIDLGIDRVLTSGGAPTARLGATKLRGLVQAAQGRIGIIAAGKVRPANVRALIAATGVREVHAHLTSAHAMRVMVGMVEGEARREKGEGVGGGSQGPDLSGPLYRGPATLIPRG